MTVNQPRTPPGIPSGGQFSSSQHGEPDIALYDDDDTHSDEADQAISGAVSEAVAAEFDTTTEVVESIIDQLDRCTRLDRDGDALTATAWDEVRVAVSEQFASRDEPGTQAWTELGDGLDVLRGLSGGERDASIRRLRVEWRATYGELAESTGLSRAMLDRIVHER